MNDYTFEELNKVLCDVGKAIFVKYFYDFTRKDNVLVNENFTEKSKSSRTSKARSIFARKQEYEALKNIVNSDHVDEEWRNKAQEILDKKNNF